MALNRLGADILHSLVGAQFGLDRHGRLVGHNGVRAPYEDATVGSTIDTNGTSVVTGSTGTVTLAAPLFRGIDKEVIWASTVSTAALALVRSTADGACSFLANTSGTTAAGGNTDVKRINLINVGGVLKLRSISSEQWAISARPASSLYYTISTSS